VDAETNVPLRVRVFSTTINDPAVDVGFTAVDYATPDPKLFGFVPPPGATVTDHQLPALTDAERAELEQGAKADRAQEPELVGSGWSAVVVADLPPDALADLAEAGQGGPSGQGADPATSALALLEALPKATGPWGSGRVLEGTLFSAIVTDDGRVALGAVGSSTLADALSGTR
jgi:hypothetical protein